MAISNDSPNMPVIGAHPAKGVSRAIYPANNQGKPVSSHVLSHSNSIHRPEKVRIRAMVFLGCTAQKSAA
jgi:hypothetical protein